MSVKHIFIDTNILVYAHDNSAGERYARASAIVEQAWHFPYPPAISTQVLQELYVNIVRKGVALNKAQPIVKNYFAWEVVKNDLVLIQQAFDVQSRWKLSYWDSLIVAAALKAKCAILWSEDFNVGQRFDSLQVENPLVTDK